MKDLKKLELKDSNSKKLDSESLEKVSGGFVHKNNNNATHNWEVIDDYDGRVLGSYQSKSEAKSRAPQLSGSRYSGQTLETISSQKLKKLRERG